MRLLSGGQAQGRTTEQKLMCYSRPVMGYDQSTKALVLALTDDASAAVYTINRLKPETLCFVLPDTSKKLVESSVQPHIEQMPRRWDWVVTEQCEDFTSCHQTLARSLPDLLRTWEVQPGELAVQVSGATPAMAGALTIVTLPLSPRIISLVPSEITAEEAEAIDLNGRIVVWTQCNPWDEGATVSRHEGAELFNRGLFASAAKLFRDIE